MHFLHIYDQLVPVQVMSLNIKQKYVLYPTVIILKNGYRIWDVWVFLFSSVFQDGKEFTYPVSMVVTKAICLLER